MAADLHFTALGDRAAHPSAILSHLGGLATTATIFALLAWSTGEPDEEESVNFDEVHAVSLLDLPPPPKSEELPEQPPAAVNPLLLLAEERTGSDFRLPAAPIVPKFVPQATGRIQFDFSMDAMKPSLAGPEVEPRHVFERSEVDELPRAILKKSPRLTTTMTKDLKARSLRFLFIVDVDGSPEQVRLLSSTGDEIVDSLCLQAMNAWRFTPAIRKGKKVRCWVEQGFNLRASTRSPFES